MRRLPFPVLSCLSYCLLSVFPPAPLRAAEPEPPTEWIDAATGHRVVRLSREPGTASLYFHQNAYTPDGQKLVVTNPHGVATINLATRAIEQVVEGRVAVIVVGRRSGAIYFTRRDATGRAAVFALNLATKAERRIADVPRGGVSSLNADESLLLGAYSEESDAWSGAQPGTGAPNLTSTSGAQPAGGGARATFQRDYSATRPDGTPMPFAEAKEFRLHEQLARVRAGAPRTLFTLATATGEIRVVHRAREWFGHLQFSPTDPALIMFCHEGPWHEVDRIWTIRTDGTGLQKIHARTQNMEIAGHEFFAADGRTLWYDLQTPRGEDFWLAGYEPATARRTWWHLQRDEWSVHFNVSPDGTLFAGDGGDSGMVAHAPDGKWIYLFRPAPVPDVAGIKNPSDPALVHAGRLVAERLVNLSAHDYRLEPNVSFTPDQKWIVFRSNLHGPTHTYAVEIRK